MKLKKIKTLSFPDALKAMRIGETCIAPDECTRGYVKRMCSGLKDEGYIFVTSTRVGEMTITRLK